MPENDLTTPARREGAKEYISAVV